MEKAIQSFHQNYAIYIAGKHIGADPNDIEGNVDLPL
jgi:hypothetical protein